MVIPNVWCVKNPRCIQGATETNYGVPLSRQISRDSTIYDDPSTFNPDRFINNPNILDPRDFVFGFGRRACPGSYLAYQMMWTFVVSTLWAFELERPEGEPPLDKDADRFDFGFLK